MCGCLQSHWPESRDVEIASPDELLLYNLLLLTGASPSCIRGKCQEKRNIRQFRNNLLVGGSFFPSHGEPFVVFGGFAMSVWSKVQQSVFSERPLRLGHSPQMNASHFCLFSLSQGSKASVQSQPADTSSLLQIPKDHFHRVRARDHLVRESKPRVSQQMHSPSAERLLRRQVSTLMTVNLLRFYTVVLYFGVSRLTILQIQGGIHRETSGEL